MPETTEIKESETKMRTSVSLSQYLYGRMEDLVRKKEFTSRSDLISTALGEFFGRYDERAESSKRAQLNKQQTQNYTQETSEFSRLIEAYLKTDEGKSFLRSRQQNNNSMQIIDGNPRDNEWWS